MPQVLSAVLNPNISKRVSSWMTGLFSVAQIPKRWHEETGIAGKSWNMGINPLETWAYMKKTRLQSQEDFECNTFILQKESVTS